MDPKTGQNTPTTQTNQPVIKKRGGFFSIVGKLFLFAILAGGILVGGYFLGIKTTKNSAPTQTAAQATVTPTALPPSPTATSPITKTVKAGLSTNTAFKPYALDVPTGWIDARESTVTADIDKLTLIKDGYSVTLYQAAMGGGGCLYPGDKPSEMAQTFTDFTDINGKSGQFRRSWNTPGAAKTISYTICQQSTVDKSFGSITTFGAINVVSPNPANTTVLTEIDGIIASLIQQ